MAARMAKRRNSSAGRPSWYPSTSSLLPSQERRSPVSLTFDPWFLKAERGLPFDDCFRVTGKRERTESLPHCRLFRELSPRIETPNRSLLRKARFLSSGLLPSSRDPARIGHKCEREPATSQSRTFGQRAEPARLNPDRCTIKQAATAAQKKRGAVPVHAFRCSVHWAKAEGDEISARWLGRNGDEFQVICR